MIINLATLLSHLRTRGINPAHVTVQVDDAVLMPIHRFRFKEQNPDLPDFDEDDDYEEEAD